MNVTIRPITADDIAECARIVYEAFGHIQDRHRFSRDFPTPEAAVEFVTGAVQHPQFYGVVAEQDGRILGSNFLSERNPIRGVGPITVAPELHVRGVGRKLMEAVIERGRPAAGIRLVQEAYNAISISLYASLGFEVREPLLLMSGKPAGGPDANIEVRHMRPDDLEPCALLCHRVHGFDRTGELRDALQMFAPAVAVRDGRITAYASAPTFWLLNHGVAETERDMQALILGAASLNEQPLALLIPARQASLFRGCLRAGLRVVKPMTLMSLGSYQEPTACWFPSVEY